MVSAVAVEASATTVPSFATTTRGEPTTTSTMSNTFNNNTNDGVPATAKDSTDNKSNDVFVIKKSVILWVLVTIALLAIVIGGFCGAGKCGGGGAEVDTTSDAVSDTSTAKTQPTPAPNLRTPSAPSNGVTVDEEAASCSSNADCTNSVCAHKHISSGGLVCCPSGADKYLFSPYRKDVCTGQPVGELCAGEDRLCASGVCFEGSCLASRRESGEACERNAHCMSTSCINQVCSNGPALVGNACDDGNDCANGVCAHKTIASGDLVCCPSGASDYLFSPHSKDVCTGQPVGELCAGEDGLCASGVCFQGKCLESPQSDGASCERNGHCVSLSCVSGLCTSGPANAGAACDDGYDCANRVCAHSSIAGPKVCCPSGASDYLFSPHSKEVCTGQPVGELCAGEDVLCDSGVCFQGACLEGRQNTGQSCERNTHCTSLSCVVGVCSNGLGLANATCDDNSDCANGVCGYATISGTLVCCLSGASEYLYSPISKEVCTGQPEGELCADEDDLCRSGVCLAGTCLAEQQAAGEACENNSHCSSFSCVGGVCASGIAGPGEPCDDTGDCANGVCGLSSLAERKSICCPSGSSDYLYSPISEEVCTGQETGSACGGENVLCASGSCVNGVCA